MKKLYSSASRILATAACALLVCLLATPAARADVVQTFVSVSGTDANAGVGCIRSKPCRFIQKALDVTLPGGIVTVLDSANFGAFTITQSVEIVAAPGAQALIGPPSGPLIVIEAPDAVVTLRGLYLNAPENDPSTQHGIIVEAVSVLHVENCTISGLAGNGIYTNPAPSNKPIEIYISDTIIRNLHSNAIVLFGFASNIPLRVVIDRVRLENNNSGVSINRNVDVIISDSVLSGNQYGIEVRSPVAGEVTEVVIKNCQITGNAIGINSLGGQGGTPVDVEGTTISFNQTGLHTAPGGGIYSRKDNTLRRNTTNGAFTNFFSPL